MTAALAAAGDSKKKGKKENCSIKILAYTYSTIHGRLIKTTIK